jgi:hypothetical protein
MIDFEINQLDKSLFNGLAIAGAKTSASKQPNCADYLDKTFDLKNKRY